MVPTSVDLTIRSATKDLIVPYTFSCLGLGKSGGGMEIKRYHKPIKHEQDKGGRTGVKCGMVF